MASMALKMWRGSEGVKNGPLGTEMKDKAAFETGQTKERSDRNEGSGL